MEDPTGSHFQVFGSGFLAAPGCVVTNRHVILSIEKERQRLRLAENSRQLMFYSVESALTVRMTLAHVRRQMFFAPPEFDVGLLLIDANGEGVRGRIPLSAPAWFSAHVGDAVACMGYPYGLSAMQRKDDTGIPRSYRFGPILQRGFVSAIAPFDAASPLDRLVLDLRTAKFMSGAPVVAVDTGELLGVHDAGIGSEVAFCVPLSAPVIEACHQLALSPPREETGVWKGGVEVEIPRVFRAPDEAPASQAGT